ncbi:MAG: glycosyltransferase family 39 protein [Anaerolineae bacterium]
MAPALNQTRPRSTRREILAVVLLLAVALALRLYRLDVPSYTWDEATDREIAFSYLLNGDLTAADREPSQARLPIYVETLVLKLWGDSEFKLRFPSVIAGALSLLVIWRIGRLIFEPWTGVVAMGLAAFNPFHLLLSRLSGTHGDALLALFYTLALWLLLKFWQQRHTHEGDKFSAPELSYLLLFGFVSGVATGSKLSGVLILGNLLVVAVQEHRTWRYTFPWLLLTGLLWVGGFLLTSPIYLRWENVLAAWQDQQQHWQQIRGLHFLGRVYETLPRWYWAVVIPLKFTIPFALALWFQIGWLLARFKSRSTLEKLLLFNLYPLLFLVARRWQSPTYAVLLIGPFFALAGRSVHQLIALARDQHRRIPRWAYALVLLALVLLVGENARVLAVTHPDYLMTGYDFGDAVIGEFWGPAVFHCQGAGQALKYLADQPPGEILAPATCGIMMGYYRIVYDLPEITFQTELERPEDVLNYRYVIYDYHTTYMTTPYPLKQESRALRQGAQQYCDLIHTYQLRDRELFWIYECAHE